MDKYAILWDLDGVLADSTQFHFESWAVVFQKRGIRVTEAMFKRTFGQNNRSALTDYLGRPPSEAELAEIGEEKEVLFRDRLPGRLQLLPGALDWLQRFQDWGYPQAVASSAPPENIDTMMDVLQIRPFFRELASGADLPGKPDPAVFLLAAQRLGVPPARCLVLEDSPAGIQGAHRAGMQCIAVLTTHPAAELQSADLIVNRLTDMTSDQVRGLLS